MNKIDGVLGVNSLALAKFWDLTFWNGKDIEMIFNTKSHFILTSKEALYHPFPFGFAERIIVVDNPRLFFIKYCWEHHPPNNFDVITKGYNLLVGKGTVLDGDGFGYEYDPYENKQVKFPHYGGVRIGDNVEIGSNSCIDRGTFGDTCICDGVKIDNLVHVAHNVHIGENSLIVAGTVLGGGSWIGENVFVGIKAAIRNQAKIGDNAFIGMGAVVVKDVPAGTTVIGNPAKKYERY